MVDLKAEKEALHKEFMTELIKEDASKKNIDKIAKSMNSNQGKMLKAKTAYLLKVKDVLPADHYKKFLMKGYGCGSGCKKSCCAPKAHGCKSSCSSHGASKCSSAGAKGHTCTSACKTPCTVKVKK